MHINRSAVIVKAKQPFVDWVNSTPDEEIGQEPHVATLDEVNQDCLVLLIPNFETMKETESALNSLKAEIFEFQLEGWHSDESVWPKNRSAELFDQWIALEFHSEILDIVTEPIEKEDLND
jgi:hypothetical protein